MSNISDFIARLGKSGILKSNRYRMYFSGNGFSSAVTVSNIDIGLSGLNELLSDSCEEISFPGSSVASEAYRIHGPPRDIPYERLFEGDLTATFRMDGNGLIRRFFTNWQNLIVDPDSNELGYYDDYICDLTIDVINRKDEVIMTGKLYEVWPKQINEIALGYANEDYIKQQVAFAYRKFVQE